MEPLEDPKGEILGAAPVGLAVVVAPGRIQWANEAYFRLSGRDPSLLGRSLHDLADESGTLSPQIRSAIDTALREGRPASFRAVQAAYRHREGGVFLDVDVRPVPVGVDGSTRAIIVVGEVTERVEEHGRAQRFYSSFMTSSNAIEITDARGVLVDVNPTFERIYGYSRAECLGKKPSLVRSRKTPPGVYERMWADLVNPARGFWSGELQNRDRRGQERPVFLTITAVRDEGGTTTHYVAVAIDLLEQKSWERAAGHAERLTSLGQLAAGVAHEINTPLANVMLVAESLRRRSTDPWVRERLDSISTQVELAANIVRGLLDFARRNEPDIASLDLREVARSALEFIQGKQSADVEVELEVAPEPIPIWGDRSQLIQVLTNLINNAYDAMEGHGRLRVGVRRVGDDAQIDVDDTGPGLPEESMGHLFEPFYTTKPEGEGTGLGLAICHGIVQAHHGTIVARNLAERGASFRITLPIAAGPAPSTFR